MGWEKLVDKEREDGMEGVSAQNWSKTMEIGKSLEDKPINSNDRT